MVEGGEHQRLALEAGHAVGVGGERVGEDFDGDFASELGVGGAPDDAHPALAELGGDAVVRDGFLSGHWSENRTMSQTAPPGYARENAGMRAEAVRR